MDLSLGLSKHVEAFYPFPIEEFGVDLAIDREGNIWLFELNTGPRIRRKTFERACNRVDYAIHVARKGMMKDISVLEALAGTRKACIDLEKARKSLISVVNKEDEGAIISQLEELSKKAEELSKNMQFLGENGLLLPEVNFEDAIKLKIATEQLKDTIDKDKRAVFFEKSLGNWEQIIDSWKDAIEKTQEKWKNETGPENWEECIDRGREICRKLHKGIAILLPQLSREGNEEAEKLFDTFLRGLNALKKDILSLQDSGLLTNGANDKDILKLKEIVLESKAEFGRQEKVSKVRKRMIELGSGVNMWEENLGIAKKNLKSNFEDNLRQVK